MMVIEEPDYESDFDNESDIADLEEEDDGEDNYEDSNSDNDSTNEQISTEEENSINKNATNSISNNAANLRNKLNRNIKSSSDGSGDNKNKINIETTKNDKNKQNLNGNTKENVVVNSDSSTSSEIESEIIDNEDINKRITTEFQEMKMKFHQDDRIHDVEMEYKMTQRISNSQKYIGSSTDTTNDENVQRTFQVEVFIENQRLDSDNTEELKQRIERKEGSSTKEDTSADELSEDSDVEDNNDDEENDNNDNNDNQNENENLSGEEEEEEVDEDQNKDETENDIEYKVQHDNIKERNDKSDTSLEEHHDQDINENENNSELNEINLKAIITDQSGNLIKYSNEESETILKNKGDIRQSTDSSISIEISSRRPSSFNSDECPLRLKCVNKRKSTPDLRKKQNQNKNLSFSNSRMRDIERSNQVLLKKILTQKSTYEAKTKQKKNVKNNTRQTSAEINRKKQQRQIDLDNQVLKRKLEAISIRNRHH